MSANHDDDALAAYVVGGLTAAERVDVERHVQECARCAAELSALRPVATALADAAPRRTPRPELRQRVLAAVGVESMALPPQRASSPDARSLSIGWLAAAALLALSVVAAYYAINTQRQLTVLTQELEATRVQLETAVRELDSTRDATQRVQFATNVMSAPDLARIDLAGQPGAPNASARALWSRQRGLVFAATALPPLGADMVYQVWIVTAQGPISAGLLPSDGINELRVFQTSPDIPPPTAVAVTPEPAGGRPAPTGPIVLAGSPQA